MESRLISIIMFVCSVCVPQNSAEKCHAAQAMKDFDVQRFSGKWYAYQVSDVTKAKDCMVYNWPNTTENVIDVKKSYRLGLMYPVTDIPLRQVSTTSKFTMKASLLPSDKRIGWVLGTDYTEYAAIYLCDPISITKGYTMVWTRDENLADKIIKKAYMNLTENGFQTTLMFNIIRFACTN